MVRPWHTICGQAYAKVYIHPHIPRNTLSGFELGLKTKSYYHITAPQDFVSTVWRLVFGLGLVK